MRITLLLGAILDLLIPPSCAFCRSPINESGIPRFCSQCWSDFAAVKGGVCPRCGRPFGSPEALTHSPDHECFTCRKDPPHFDQAFAAGLFEGPLREAIHLYKYRPVRALGKPLAAWMAGQVRFDARPDLVMPVPLHRKRLRHRGFNQALLLADGITRHFDLSLCFDNLVRTRPTRPQVELTGAERAVNVKGAFSLLRPEEIEDKGILLIDDVFTTGATMNECARVLKEAGARSVVAFTLARTGE